MPPSKGNALITILIGIFVVLSLGLVFLLWSRFKAESSLSLPVIPSTTTDLNTAQEIKKNKIVYDEPPVKLNPLVVVLINFTNDKSEPFTKDKVNDVIFSPTNPQSVYSYYRESSYNKFTFTGDVLGWYTIPATNENCNYVGWRQATEATLKLEEVELARYKHVLYLLPHTSCYWGGLAETVGILPSVSYINGDLNTNIIIHELAHNLGVGHAGTIDCRYVDGNLSVGDYNKCSMGTSGDPFDPMGHNPYNNHFNAPHKIALGWMPGANVINVQKSGTYSLVPVEIKTGSPQVLKVKKTDTNDFYYVEYRQPLGFDSVVAFNSSHGTNITIENKTINTFDLTDTYLVHANPKSLGYELEDGTSFHDQINNITITQRSHSNNAAEIEVSL